MGIPGVTNPGLPLTQLLRVMDSTLKDDVKLTKKEAAVSELSEGDCVVLLGANSLHPRASLPTNTPGICTVSEVSTWDDEEEEENENKHELPMETLRIRSLSPSEISSITNSTHESRLEQTTDAPTVFKRKALNPIQRNDIIKSRFIPFADLGYVFNPSSNQTSLPQTSQELHDVEDAIETQMNLEYDIEIATVSSEGGSTKQVDDEKKAFYATNEIRILDDGVDVSQHGRIGENMFSKLSTTPPSPSYSTIFCNRLTICVIEILILWCTSLRVVTTVVRNYIPSPTLTQVGQECSASYETIELQQERYSSCSRAQTQECFAYLKMEVVDEQTRVGEVEAMNNKLISQMRNASLNMFYDYDLLVNSLQNWVEANPTIGVAYSTNCSPINQSTVQSLIGDYSSSANRILSSSLAYTHASDQRVANMAKYDNEKNDYTIFYIHDKLENIGISLDRTLTLSNEMHGQYQNVTNADIENMMYITDSCFNASTINSEGCPYAPTMFEVYGNIQQDMDIQKSTVESHFEANKEVANEYEAQVQNAIQNADAFFDAAESIKEYLYALNIVGLDLCQFSFCDFTKLSWAVPRLRLPDPISVRSVPSKGELSRTLGPVLQGVEVMFNSSLLYGQTINENIQKHYEGSIGSLDLNVTDYQPPIYQHAASFQEEAQLQATTSAAYLSSLDNNMSDFSSTPHADLSTSVGDTVSNASATFSRSSMSAYDLFIGPWLSGNIDSSVFMSTIEAIEYFLIIFDVIYRVFQSLKVIRKHWRGVITSPLDIRTNKNLFCNSIFGRRTNINPNSLLNNKNVRMFCMLFYHLWFYVMALMVFMTVVLTSMIHLYVPIFDSYVTHCVHKGQVLSSSSSPTSTSRSNHSAVESFMSNITNSGEFNDATVLKYSGTFLARNLNSMAVNYASMNGNAEITRSVSDYNVASSDACSEHFIATSTTYQEQSRVFEQARADYFDRLYRRNFIYDCVNATALSDLFSSACNRDDGSGNMENHNLDCPRPYEFYPSPNSDKDALYYQVAMSTMEYNVFDCSVLPTCTLSCSGPETQIIQSESTKCACVGEWMIHANILQGLMIIFVYILLNISRVVTFKGIGNLLWKHLSLRQYEFIGSCTYHGDIIDDKEYFSADCSSSDGKTLHKMIVKMENNFHWKGVSLIAIGLLFNAPYMWALHTIRANIEYTP